MAPVQAYHEPHFCVLFLGVDGKDGENCKVSSSPSFQLFSVTPSLVASDSDQRNKGHSAVCYDPGQLGTGGIMPRHCLSAGAGRATLGALCSQAVDAVWKKPWPWQLDREQPWQWGGAWEVPEVGLGFLCDIAWGCSWALWLHPKPRLTELTPPSQKQALHLLTVTNILLQIFLYLPLRMMRVSIFMWKYVSVSWQCPYFILQIHVRIFVLFCKPWPHQQ